MSTNITDLKEFLHHIVSNTNMTCITPIDDGKTVRSCPVFYPCKFSNYSLLQSIASAGSSFLAANLYARSVFGEDALVNVSVERKDDVGGSLAGYIRIRSKTQGIALSLGDRITSIQRLTKSKTGQP